MKKTILFAVVFSVAVTGCSSKKRQARALYEQGARLVQEKDYQGALPVLKEAADLGNGDAAFQLGVLYTEGKGVETNPVEALSWFERSADRGHVEGMFRSGQCYQQGLGTGVNEEKALGWRTAEPRGGIPGSTAAPCFRTIGQWSKVRKKKPSPWEKRSGIRGL